MSGGQWVTFVSGHRVFAEGPQRFELPADWGAVRVSRENQSWWPLSTKVNGRFSFPVTVHRQDRTPDTKSLELEISFDDGATWTPVPVSRDGVQRMATVTHPARAFASLRAKASDSEGNSLEQTARTGSADRRSERGAGPRVTQPLIGHSVLRCHRPMSLACIEGGRK